MSAPPSRYFRPGQFIFHENDVSDSLFLVKKGTVSIRKRKGSDYVEIARIYANEIIGEISYFDRSPRSASAMALTEVEITEIRFDAFDRILKNVPSYFRTIVAAMAERLRKADDIIRRLERETISADDGLPKQEQKESAADVLAATASILDEETGQAESTPADPSGTPEDSKKK